MDIRKIILSFAFFIVAFSGWAIEGPSAKNLNEFAVKCAENGLWGEAEFRLRRAIGLNDNDARLHNNLAVALEAQGELDEAYQEYLRAVNLDGSNDDFRYNLDEFIKTHNWDVESAPTETAEDDGTGQ